MNVARALVLMAGSMVLQTVAPAGAQTVSVPQVRNDMTMQDMENNALRATTRQASAGADAAFGGTSRGNVFQSTQTGDYNTVKAAQIGIENIALVTQVGQMNTASITQTGTGNRVTLHQGR